MAKNQPVSADDVKLAPFEGREVLSTAVSVTRAGDGLSKALAVEPREMQLGETGVLVLEYEVGKVRFDPVPDTNGLQRVHVLIAGTATFIDEDVVRDALTAQQRRIDEAAGVFHLPFGAAPVPAEGAELTDAEWDEQIAAAEAQEAAEDAAKANGS